MYRLIVNLEIIDLPFAGYRYSYVDLLYVFDRFRGREGLRAIILFVK